MFLSSIGAAAIMMMRSLAVMMGCRLMMGCCAMMVLARRMLLFGLGHCFLLKPPLIKISERVRSSTGSGFRRQQ
jgi:hypothetical protein